MDAFRFGGTGGPEELYALVGQQANGKVMVCSLRPKLSAAFKIMRLDKLL